MHAVNRLGTSEMVNYLLQAAKLHGVRVINELIDLLTSHVGGQVITLAFAHCFPGTALHPPWSINSKVKYASLIGSSVYPAASGMARIE